MKSSRFSPYLAPAVLLLLANLPALGAPALPLPVRIETVIHNTRSPLGAGGRLAVSLRGTGGGSGTFHILGVATDIGMRELRGAGYQALPALYTGTYIVRPGDAVRNAAVFAILTVRERELMAVSPQPITIDTRAPLILARQPKPGVQLANTRPNISIDMVDLESGVNPASVRLLVNGQNVTAKASISETSVAYNPETPFSPGPVRVEMTVADKARNALRSDWTFHIAAPAGLIASVTINPASALTKDDVLTVVMTGAPGGKASFTIQGIRAEFPMRESRTAGLYFGTLTVGQAHAALDAPLLVTLTKDGLKRTVSAATVVTILPSPPAAPTVTTPDRSISFDEPTARLIARGSSRPRFRIFGRIEYTVQSPSFEGEGVLGEFLVIADANGNWRASVGPLVPLRQARLNITVVAIDPAGQRSPAVTLELTSQ